MNVTITINVDFDELRTQKATLLQAIENQRTVEEGRHLDGILNLLDAIMDAAVDQAGVEESKVFGG